MPKGKKEEIIDLDGWYTPLMAARMLSITSGREIKPQYVRSLARLGKVRFKPVGNRLNLYNKEDIDAYVVEERGEKAGRAQHARKVAKKTKQAA